MEASAKKPKEKRRNNEKRKEKSRDAARTRRSRETEIFNELSQALPLCRENVEQLDKASVMRLAIAHLKVRDMVEALNFKNEVAHIKMEEDIGVEIIEKMLMTALDGFLIVMSDEGDITYVSDNVADFLGIQQIDLLGQPIWDYSHQCDHEELRDALKKRAKGDDLRPVDLFLRLKCTLTSRGRSVNIKSASYKVIHVTGHVINGAENSKRMMIAVGHPIPHPTSIEFPLGSSTFLTKHSLDMKFTYLDEKLCSTLGYKTESLVGKSLYEYHHGADSEYLMGTFKCLLSKGQMETKKYRFLAHSGGYAWLVTQATLVYDKQKPQSVVCVNYVISGIENENEIYSCAQLEAKNQLEEKCESEEKNKLPEAVKPPQTGQQRKCVTVDSSDNTNKKAEQTASSSSVIVKKGQQESKPVVSSLAGDHRNKLVIPSAKSCNNRNKSELIKVDLLPAIRGFAVNRPRSVTEQLFAESRSQGVVQNPPSINVNRPISVTDQVYQNTIQKQSYNNNRSSKGAQQPNQKAFGDRTEDMNKGLYLFSDDEPGLTMLKEEPDDLIHLAPTPGDACISLEEPTSFLSSYDEFNDLIDNYFLRDDISSLDTANTTTTASTSSNPQLGSGHHQHQQQSLTVGLSLNTTSSGNLLNNTSQINRNIFGDAFVTTGQNSILCHSNSNSNSSICSDSNSSNSLKVDLGNSGTNTDPFINYRDESSDTSGSPHLLSPGGGSSKSPDGSSIPSLCSPNGSLHDDDLAFMTSINMDDDIDDLSMRAPYISMCEGDDLPLLISEDLMWGALPEGLNLPKTKGGAASQKGLETADTKSVGVKSANDFSNSSNLMALLANNNNSISRNGVASERIDDDVKSSTAEDDVDFLRGSKMVVQIDDEDITNASNEENQEIIGQILNSNSKQCPGSDLQNWTLSDFINFGDADQNGLNSSDVKQQNQQQLQFKIKTETNRKSFNNNNSNFGLSNHQHQSNHHQSTKRPLAQSHQNNQQLTAIVQTVGLAEDDFLLRENSDGNHAKRLKCDTSSSSRTLKTSPQLLQQLTAAVPSTKLLSKDKGLNSSNNSKSKGWNSSDNNITVKSSLNTGNLCSNNSSSSNFNKTSNANKKQQQQQQHQQQQQSPSNSVLMNLLKPLHIETPPNDSEKMDISPLSTCSLSCDSDSMAIFKSSAQNPLIGGVLSQLTPTSSMDSSMSSIICCASASPQMDRFLEESSADGTEEALPYLLMMDLESNSDLDTPDANFFTELNFKMH